MAAARPLTALRPLCGECAGGGAINGVPCRVCDGAGRQPVRERLTGWRKAVRDWAHARAEPAGKAVGRILRWSQTLPGIGGAACVSVGAAMTAHGMWHALPEWGVGLLAAGVFGLMADRNMARP